MSEPLASCLKTCLFSHTCRADGGGGSSDDGGGRRRSWYGPLPLALPRLPGGRAAGRLRGRCLRGTRYGQPDISPESRREPGTGPGHAGQRADRWAGHQRSGRHSGARGPRFGGGRARGRGCRGGGCCGELPRSHEAEGPRTGWVSSSSPWCRSPAMITFRAQASPKPWLKPDPTWPVPSWPAFSSCWPCVGVGRGCPHPDKTCPFLSLA